MHFWWNEKPIKSTLGILRLHGLLHIGKFADKGRMFKMAFVPKDIREKLHKEAAPAGNSRKPG